MGLAELPTDVVDWSCAFGTLLGRPVEIGHASAEMTAALSHVILHPPACSQAGLSILETVSEVKKVSLTRRQVPVLQMEATAAIECHPRDYV